MEKVAIYLIKASTGCSCCGDENFVEGPYVDGCTPRAIIERWRSGCGNPLASQYAKFGRYSLDEREAEAIGDGRYIIDDQVWGLEIERKWR